MEAESERSVSKNPEARIAEIVQRRGKHQDKAGETRSRVESQRQKGDEREPGFMGNDAPAGGFARFDINRFKDNSYLEELAKKVQIAGRQNKIDDKFLEGVQGDLTKGVQFGMVSDNWARNFSAYLNEVVVEERLGEARSEDKELLQDVSAIVALRKKRGLSAEEAQASRVVFEHAFGRKLTEQEFGRAMRGENLSSTTESAKRFESQIQMIEKIVNEPKRFDAFLTSTEKIDAESLRQVMSGKAGELMLSLLLGDIPDRDEYSERLRKITSGEALNVKKGLSALVRDIERKEKEDAPKIPDPDRVKAAKRAWEKVVEEIKKKRNLTEDEIEAIRSLAERGSPPIEGGADGDPNMEKKRYEEFLEGIQNIPEDDEDAFKRFKAAYVKDDYVRYLANLAYGQNPLDIQEELTRWEGLNDDDNVYSYKQNVSEFMSRLFNRATEQMERQLSVEEKDAAKRLARGEKINRRGMNFSFDEDIDFADESIFGREPGNIRELALWIIATDDAKIWSPNGPYPLFTRSEDETEEVEKINPETGRREKMEVKKVIFQEENFLKWVRNKMLELHYDNPNDPMSPLDKVAIQTLFRPVNLVEMKYNKQRYFSDPNTGQVLEHLYNEVINEAWLFGVRRNNDLAYKQVMTSDSNLFDRLVEINSRNDHTSGSTLANMLRMADEYSRDTDGKADNRVGDSLLIMNQIYRNLSDEKNLRNILPPDALVYTAKGFRDAVRAIKGMDFDEELTEYGNYRFEGEKIYHIDPQTKIRTVIFDENGKLTSDKALIKYLNFFPSANPEETSEVLVREIVKQTAAKIVGFHTGSDKAQYEKFKKRHGQDLSVEEYRKLSRINLEWAEINSWSEQRWSGVAARNDTNYRGYDAWTKMYMQYYRERQSGSRTSGPIGNPEDMQIFRMLSPDMWLAIRTESGESVQEVFDNIHKVNIQLYSLPKDENLTDEQKALKERLVQQKDALYDVLRFPRFTQSDWAANGIKRQSEVWHDVLDTEDIKFNEIIKRNDWGVLKFDRAKFEEIVKDTFIKKRRYAFSSNNAINYGALTRMRVRTAVEFNKDGTVKDGSEKYEYKDMYLAEAMFGDVVIGSIRRDWYAGKLKYKAADEDGNEKEKRAWTGDGEYNPKEKHGTFAGYLNSQDARTRILKNVCRAGLAAQLKAHRNRASVDDRWDAHTIRKFYQALRSMPQYIEDPATGKEIEIPNSQFFSEEDIEWIRKHSNTTRWHLFREDALHSMGDIAVEVLPAAFMIFIDDVFDDLFD